jgi:hypothetical protein
LQILISVIIFETLVEMQLMSAKDVPLQMNGLRKCGIYTHGILLSHEQE